MSTFLEYDEQTAKMIIYSNKNKHNNVYVARRKLTYGPVLYACSVAFTKCFLGAQFNARSEISCRAMNATPLSADSATVVRKLHCCGSRQNGYQRQQSSAKNREKSAVWNSKSR